MNRNVGTYARIFCSFFVIVMILVTVTLSNAADNGTLRRNSEQNQNTSGPAGVKAMSSTSIDRNSDTGPDAGSQFAGSDLFFNEDVLPDLFTGTMKYQLPINIPTGINGMKPSITLVYKSTNGNGWMGVGWDYSPGMIARNPKKGGDLNADNFVVTDSNGSDELVKLDDQTFSYKIISEHKRIKRLTTPDGNRYWEITDTKGIRFIYGYAGSNRLIDQHAATNVSKWFLEKVVDPNGNYIKYNYDQSGNQVYLASIEYTGNENSGLPPISRIVFTSTGRNDHTESYRYSILEKLNNRLSQIDIYTNNTLIKSYHLNYEQTSGIAASKLSSVDEVAPDGTTLPVATFSYSSADNHFTTGAATTLGTGNPYSYFLSDVDGDGKTDIVAVGTTGVINVAHASESGFDPVSQWHAGLGNGNPYQYRFGDINGDGKADLLYLHDPFSEWGSDTACISNGVSTFGQCTPVAYPFETPGGYWYQFNQADFTGDGKTDIIYSYFPFGQLNITKSTSTDTPSFSGYTTWLTMGLGNYVTYFYADYNGDGKTDVMYNNSGPFYVALSNGSNFAAFDGTTDGVNLFSHFYWQTIGDGYSDVYRVADFNGDGKADLLWLGEDGSLYTALSTGKSFVGADGETNWANSGKFYWGRLGLAASNLFGYFTGRYQIGDFNGDGKADMLWIAPEGKLYVALSNGYQFVAPNGETNWINNPDAFLWGQLGDGDYTRYRIGDFNGDGKSDVMYVNASGNITVLFSSGGPEALLNHIETRQNGTIDIQYVSTSTFLNTQLPFALNVVRSVTVNDGNPLKAANGISASSTYSLFYSDGYYSFSEREFRGFSRVDIDGPFGPSGEQAIKMIWFHQGDGRLASAPDNPSAQDAFMRGKPYRIRTEDRAPPIRNSSLTTWTQRRAPISILSPLSHPANAWLP